MEERQRCEVYVRVMGYYRPVSQFNIGKQAEHYNRKQFEEVVMANNSFSQEYGA